MSTIPKGFFPDPGHRRHSGRHAGRAGDLVRQDGAAAAGSSPTSILNDPDVESLSSFIGVDGSNVTLNSGRFLINLKPHDKRKSSASEIIRRLQKETEDVAGISLFMQPVQDLSIDTAVSATQYQFTLAEPGPRDAAGVDAEGAGAARAKFPTSSTSPAICSRTAAPCPSTSTAPPPRASASRRPRSTTRSTTPSASASSRPSSRSPTNIASSSTSIRR